MRGDAGADLHRRPLVAVDLAEWFAAAASASMFACDCRLTLYGEGTKPETLTRIDSCVCSMIALPELRRMKDALQLRSRRHALMRYRPALVTHRNHS